MSPADCPPDNLLLDFLLGRANLQEGERIEGHAEHCAACRETLNRLDGSTDELVSALRVPLDDPSLDAHCRRMMEQSLSWLTQEQAADAELPTLRRLRDYELLEPIGQGGMGSVYRAIHSRLKRIVAIKVIARHRLQNPTMVDRFSREMESVGRLDHPHIVRALDAGEAEGVHYLVMELLEGLDSQQLVRRAGPLPLADACELLLQAIAGLKHAHRHQMIHRDIKPSNLFVTSDGHLRILDFGLAQLVNSERLESNPEIAGSLDYMPPEQLDGKPLDARADIFALGVTFYYWLTQAWPGTSEPAPSLLAVTKRRWSLPLVPIRKRRPDVPLELEALLLQMLATEVDQRASDLEAIEAVVTPHAHGANLSPLLAKAGVEGLQNPNPQRSGSVKHHDDDPRAERPRTSALHPPVQRSLLRSRRMQGLGLAASLLTILGGLSVWKAWNLRKPASNASTSPAHDSSHGVSSLPASPKEPLSHRELYQLQVQEEARTILITFVPGETICLRESKSDGPDSIVRAWDLLELKIQEPEAFALYQRYWPQDLGVVRLTHLPTPLAESAGSPAMIQARRIKLTKGQRMVETWTPTARVVASPASDAPQIVLEFYSPQSDSLERREAISDAATDDRIRNYWAPWADETSP